MHGPRPDWMKAKTRVSEHQLMAEEIQHVGAISGTPILYVWTMRRLCLFWDFRDNTRGRNQHT